MLRRRALLALQQRTSLRLASISTDNHLPKPEGEFGPTPSDLGHGMMPLITVWAVTHVALVIT